MVPYCAAHSRDRRKPPDSALSRILRLTPRDPTVHGGSTVHASCRPLTLRWLRHTQVVPGRPSEEAMFPEAAGERCPRQPLYVFTLTHICSRCR